MTVKFYTLDGKFIKNAKTIPTGFTGKIIWYNGETSWRLNGKFHRLGGPAYIWFDGSKEWWIDGKQVTELQCKLLHDIMKLKGLTTLP